MGSCSSGGPNKYSGMCLVRSGEATKESEDFSRAVGHPAFSTNLKRPGCSREEKATGLSSARAHFVPADTMKPFMEDDATRRAAVASEASDGRPVKSRHRGDSLNDTRRTNFPSSVAASGDYGARKKSDSRLLGNLGYDQPIDTGVGPINEHSPLAAVFSKAPADFSSTERHDSEAVSPAIASNCSAMNEADPRKQQRHHGRKESAPVQFYRWPNEYGTCIVPPPNKTVYDVHKSPCARSDYVPDSSWTECWGDQKLSSYYDQHHKPTVAMISGCGTTDKTSPTGLLPSGGLSSASISSSYCHSSSASSSTSDDSSSCRRRGSGGNGAKRSSSVSSSCPSTAELLPSTTRTSDKVHYKPEMETERRASENRPLAASQRFWNLLRSPMEPLNGGNLVGSARKYIPLNSDSSGQSDGLSVSNTVSNKNSELDRAT